MTTSTRYFAYRSDGAARVLVRVGPYGATQRLGVDTGPAWEDFPALARLAVEPDLSWDEVSADDARAFASEMGFPTALANVA